jgi:glutathionylspermidine synthase
VLSQNTGSRPRAGLIFAAGFMEDLQVVSYLAQLLRKRGVETHLLNPQQLRFENRKAFIAPEGGILPLSAIVRFHQAEWLSCKRYAAIAPHLLGASKTPVVNPGHALLSESKRLPLVWDELSLPMSTWRQLLPETRDPRNVHWRHDSSWLLKSAFCNTGDSVSSRLTLSRRRWLAAAAEATLLPSKWIAQRRFETCPIATPSGPRHPCLGVYTVGGRACGVYGRLSPTPLIDYTAADVAVLVEEENR